MHILKAIRRAMAFGLLFFVGACAEAQAADPATRSGTVKKTETGLAPYYSRRFEGKTTAGGERFRNAELVAAHPTYPLGTMVRVTNLETGGSVEVRITDRGASAENRREGVIIDVSQAAASRLKMKKDGRVRVRIEVLEWGKEEHKALPDVGKRDRTK